MKQEDDFATVKDSHVHLYRPVLELTAKLPTPTYPCVLAGMVFFSDSSLTRQKTKADTKINSGCFE